MHVCPRICALAVLTFLLGFAPAVAHEGEDHGDVPATAAVAAAPRAEAISDTFELVAVARAGTLEIYLDRWRSNAPVAGASIVIETPAGSTKASAASEQGTYTIPAPWALAGGRYDLIFTVEAGADADVLTATLPVDVQARAEPSVAVGSLPQPGPWRLSAGAMMAIAALGGALVGAALMRWSMRRRFGAGVVAIALALLLPAIGARAHEGEDHGDADHAAPVSQQRDLARRAPDGALFVPKPTQRILAIRTAVTAEGVYRRSIELPGRIIPDPNASGYVQASAGGRVSAPADGFPRLGTRVVQGDVLAYVTPPLQTIDLSDMRQRQGELDQQISIVERRIARYEQLAQRGAVTQVQLDEARLELQGLNDRRAALDRTRREPEALLASVSGVVAELNAVAGQMAQPDTVLFRIVEPARLWVEALSFDAISAARHAAAKTAEGRSLSVSYQGAGFTARSQAIPVHFRIEGETGGLRPGQFVTVYAETDVERQGIVVPRASVVRAQNGQDLVFVHVSAERFEARPVRIEPIDGERVLVLSGVAPAARIVIQGAELLDQVR